MIIQATCTDLQGAAQIFGWRLQFIWTTQPLRLYGDFLVDDAEKSAIAMRKLRTLALFPFLLGLANAPGALASDGFCTVGVTHGVPLQADENGEGVIGATDYGVGTPAVQFFDCLGINPSNAPAADDDSTNGECHVGSTAVNGYGAYAIASPAECVIDGTISATFIYEWDFEEDRNTQDLWVFSIDHFFGNGASTLGDKRKHEDSGEGQGRAYLDNSNFHEGLNKVYFTIIAEEKYRSWGSTGDYDIRFDAAEGQIAEVHKTGGNDGSGDGSDPP